uniref:Uncharacterized protein n=1 Tax=Oryza meridionalis TaxID=40149 RepID=A0A0E0D6C8_9ORYZ
MGRIFSPAVEEEQRRLLPRLAPPPPMVCPFSFRLFSSSATGKCVTNIEEKKEELFHMLAQLDIDYPSNSKYARDSRKLLYMLVEQLRDTEIHDPLWPMYERRKVLYDRLKIEALPNSAAFSSYSEKL